MTLEPLAARRRGLRVLYWLRPLRVARGWSQEELAERAGCAVGTIYLAERGRRATCLSVVHRLAGALGVPTQVLHAPPDALPDRDRPSVRPPSSRAAPAPAR